MTTTVCGPSPERAGYQVQLMSDRASRTPFAENVVWALIVVLLAISCVAFHMLWNRVNAG